MGVGPIPRSAIKAYADEFDIDGDDFDKFCRIIRAVDIEYVKLVNASSKAGDEMTALTVSADDAEGVKAVMDRLSTRAANAKRKPKLKPPVKH